MGHEMYNCLLESVCQGLKYSDCEEVLVDFVLGVDYDMQVEDAEKLVSDFVADNWDKAEKEARDLAEEAREWEMARSEAITGAY